MEGNSWKATKTIPKVDFQQSIVVMDPHQIDINIVEISVLALNNDKIMDWVIRNMHRHEFYLKYRYILENVLNGKISETIKKVLNIAVSKFDESFINGPEAIEYTEQAILQMPLEKQKRLKFVADKEKIVNILNEISAQLFKIQGYEHKREYFEDQLHVINAILQEKQELLAQQCKSPTVLKGFIFCLGHSLRKMVNINVKNSFFIQTKNRNPLVLDFEFAYFLYKNDDQLSHEIIAMEFIKYFNTILGKEYIIPYDIIPQKQGALYEFIERADTIHKIKASEQQGLVSYFQKLKSKSSQEAVLSRFAETYSGFCLIQYLMDIKDRNNANIMIRQDGSIFHIDLAFIFGSSPGGISFETAPFKMTKQYIKVLGGFESDAFRKFESLMVQHFTKLMQCRKQILWKVQILSRRNKQIRCFKDFKLQAFSKKFPKKLEKVKTFVQELIDSSFDSWKTTKYDEFQFKSNNIQK